MASGHCTGQHRYRTFPASQEVLLDTSAVEYVVGIIKDFQETIQEIVLVIPSSFS